jgi:hypothetical protein
MTASRTAKQILDPGNGLRMKLRRAVTRTDVEWREVLSPEQQAIALMAST